MVFRDITNRKLAEKKLRQANDRLPGKLIEIGTLQRELRAQAIHDSLTNLFNRWTGTGALRDTHITV